MDNANCLKCGVYFEAPFEYDRIGDEITCPECGHKMTIEYDESYSEDGDEYQHWWLESVVEQDNDDSQSIN